MSNIPMPEPVAWTVTVGEDFRNCIEITHCKEDANAQYEASTEGGYESLYMLRPLITTTQAEDYKDACVREIFGWRTIDTAPKHAEVLVWREDSGPFIAKLTDPYEVIPVEEMERENMEFPDDFEEWYSDAYGWQEGSEKPTHWMPLPPPPHNDNEQGNY